MDSYLLITHDLSNLKIMKKQDNNKNITYFHLRIVDIWNICAQFCSKICPIKDEVYEY